MWLAILLQLLIKIWSALKTKEKAIRALEQLKLKDYGQAQSYSSKTSYTIQPSAYDSAILHKLLNKLPGPLGLEISKKFETLESDKKDTYVLTTASAVKFIINCLEQKCNEISIYRQIKGNDYSFCKNIFAPQTYGKDECCTSSKPRQKHKYSSKKDFVIK